MPETYLDTILQAASRYVEVEETIFGALSELPEMMEGAKRYIQIYQGYPEQLLERKTFDLYLSILVALNHIMQFFADSSASEILFFHVNVFLAKSSYREVFGATGKTEDIQKSAHEESGGC